MSLLAQVESVVGQPCPIGQNRSGFAAMARSDQQQLAAERKAATVPARGRHVVPKPVDAISQPAIVACITLDKPTPQSNT
jgi:hypothetical protein